MQAWGYRQSRLSLLLRQDFFFYWSRFLKLRLCHVTTVKTNQDFQDLLKLFQICQDISTLSRLFELCTSGSKILTNWEILIEKIDKSTNLNLDWDFLIVKINFFKVSRFSQMSRLTTFCSCQDWDSWSRHNGDK